MGKQDHLLLGIDLRKDSRTLERAYDDESGVTARFNLNILARINRELGGSFDLDAFEHRARYHEQDGRVKIDLVSLRDQTAKIDALDLEVSFAAGEAIHTEDSFKYSVEEIDALAASVGMRADKHWLDARSELHRRFSVNPQGWTSWLFEQLVANRATPRRPNPRARRWRRYALERQRRACPLRLASATL